MKFTLNKILADAGKIRNFYHTFGYVAGSEIIEPRLFNDLIGQFREILKVRRGIDGYEMGNVLEGAICEEFDKYAELFLGARVSSIMNVLAGENWMYLGSDLSIWTSPVSQPWHRDWLTHLPIVKVGCYLSHPAEQGGELRMIPGSHRIGDSYCDQLTKALAWPRPAFGPPGGMNENNRLPRSVNYGRHPTDGDYTYITAAAAMQVCDVDDASYLPHVTFKNTTLTDLIFFDNRLIHSGTISNPSVPRVMTAANFCVNPFDTSIDLRDLGVTVGRQALAYELAELYVVDRLFAGVPVSYHPRGLLPNVDRRHLVSVHETAEYYDCDFGGLGSARVMKDFYKDAPGANVKEQMMNHLGITYRRFMQAA